MLSSNFKGLITVLEECNHIGSEHDCHLTGIGYTLDPDFSFVKVAAPYAQVLHISLQDL